MCVCVQMSVCARAKACVWAFRLLGFRGLRSPTGCGVSGSDREASIMGKPWPKRGCLAIKSTFVCVCVCMDVCMHVYMHVLCVSFF